MGVTSGVSGGTGFASAGGAGLVTIRPVMVTGSLSRVDVDMVPTMMQGVVCSAVAIYVILYGVWALVWVQQRGVLVSPEEALFQKVDRQSSDCLVFPT